MAIRTCIRTEIDDINMRLNELGFPHSILEPTVETWAAAMNIGTPLHPRNYPGFVAWAEAVRTLRERGRDHGLKPLFDDYLEMCVSPETRMGVVITQGNSATGDRERAPTTKYPRGPRSTEVLQAQTDLPLEAATSAPDDAPPPPPCEIWILLVHRQGTEVRAELSRPEVITKDGDITIWRERIILPALSVGTLRRAEDLDLEPAAAADVPLMPRR